MGENKYWMCREKGLLKHLATVKVHGIKKFVAREHLEEANVGWMSHNFQNIFLDLVEEDVQETAIAIHRLEKCDFVGIPIIVEIGDRAKIKLAHFFELLMKQSRGEEGALLVDDWHHNMANISDANGVVYASWHPIDHYWVVSAGSVESSRRMVHAARCSPAREWLSPSDLIPLV